MIARLIAFAARAFTGAYAKWSEEPTDRPKVYFANHTSNLDLVLVWSVLPIAAREKTRPIAAKDYWAQTPLRRFLAEKVFRAVLIERKNVNRTNNPIQQFQQTIDNGSSLIIFPEGGRSPTEEMLPFKSGLFHIAYSRPDIELVPVYIQNLNRVMPKGEVLPIPLLCSVTFGAPLAAVAGENKATFLERARNAVLALKP